MVLNPKKVGVSASLELRSRPIQLINLRIMSRKSYEMSAYKSTSVDKYSPLVEGFFLTYSSTSSL